MMSTNTLLRIDASARKTGSTSRALADKTVEHLSGLTNLQITKRDVSEGLPFVTEAWVAANFMPADVRTEEHKDTLALSDQLVGELKAADTLVIATPIYNFGIPATLKAWIDLIARAGLTFKYTENGPVGLLESKRAIVLVASGGTQVGSPIDHATPYLRHALSFVGITDVTFIAADALSRDAEAKIEEAHTQIEALSV